MTRRGPIPQKIDVMFMPNRSKWKLLAFWKRQVTDEKSSWPKAKHWAWIIIYVEGSNKKNAAPVNNKQPSAEWACWRQRSDNACMLTTPFSLAFRFNTVMRCQMAPTAGTTHGCYAKIIIIQLGVREAFGSSTPWWLNIPDRCTVLLCYALKGGFMLTIL